MTTCQKSTNICGPRIKKEVKKFHLVFFCTLVFILSNYGYAQPYTWTVGQLLGGNIIESGNSGGFNFYSGISGVSGTTSSNLTNQTYTASGFNIFDQSATLTLNYSASSEANLSSLKTSISGSLDNFFYNPNNSPYVLDLSDNVDPNGIPTSLNVRAAAWFSDILTISGADDLSFVKMSMHIDGHASVLNAFGEIFLAQNDPNNMSLGIALFTDAWGGIDTGNVDTTVMTLAMPVVNGNIDLRLLLNAELIFNADFFPSLMEGSLDFFNTVSFGEFQGYNSAGQLVDLSSVLGSDGYIYETLRISNNVSEPSIIALFLASLGGFYFATRQSKKVRIASINLA